MAGARVRRYFPLDAMCVIRYLTDVTAETPAFAVVPKSCHFSSLADARESLDDYREVPLVRVHSIPHSSASRDGMHATAAAVIIALLCCGD